MKIIVLAQRNAEVSLERMRPHFQAEVQAVWDLYLEGIVREFYTRVDEGGPAILTVESETVEAARREGRVDAVPFESEHRFMVTLHAGGEGPDRVFLKGAPEAVLDRCDRARIEGEDRHLDHALWAGRIEELASRGQRVLAVAMKSLEAQREI